MSNNYPPGVTGNEPEITGEVNLPAEYTVTFKLKVQVPGKGRMDATEAEDAAARIAAYAVLRAYEEQMLFDGRITIEVQ